MNTLIWIAILIVASQAIGTVLGITFWEAAMELVSVSRRTVNSHSEKIAYRNSHRFELMSNSERKESKLYKYYDFINDILLDMGWGQLGVTVEGLTVTVLLVTVVVDAIGLVIVKNVFMAALLFVICYATIIAGLFTMSRQGHMVRKRILMDTEDLLCSTISLGLKVCIQQALPKIDSSVRPAFKRFIDDVDAQSMSMPRALYRLNHALGSQFDNFCDKALSLTNAYSQGIEDSFSFNVEDNAFETELDIKAAITFSEMNSEFIQSGAVIALFVIASIGMFPSLKRFYTTTLGVTFIVGYIMASAAIFIYIKWLQSKRFEDEGGD